MRNFIITIDGKQYAVGVEEVAEGEAVQAINQPASTATAQAQTKSTAQSQSTTKASAPTAASQAASQSAKGEKVLSPFPGLIKKLLVAEGDTVKKDQPILILEAMKMDNDITAPAAGKVSFAVASGANVETNTVLAVIS